MAAGHPDTARAGAAILRLGGSATDAAVAMMLVSCSAESLFTGLSGGGFATCFDAATETTRVVDFFVAVPGLGDRRAGQGTPITVSFVGQQVPYDIGPSTVAVHGIPAGAFYLWQRWGRLDWPQIVAPAISASHGTPIPSAHAELLPDVTGAMLVGDGSKVFRSPDGSILQSGDLLYHPDHWRAFTELAEDPMSFYTGAFAEAALAEVADGGAMSKEDLAAYRVVESEPDSVELTDPQGQPMSVLARGNDLDNLLSTMLAASQRVSADPLTDPSSALALADALRSPARRAETTNLVAVDGAGDACVITTSLGLGSGVWVPGYGVHLNSMMGEGELVREQVRPGLRMGSMMSPLVVLDQDRRLVLGAGAAGGSRIRPALIQSVLRMLAGAHPQAAIDAPRLVAQPGMVRLEPGFSDSVITALIAAGNEVRVADGQAPYFGGVTAVSRQGGGADPRRSGVVINLD